MGHLEHREEAPKKVNFAIVTISDSRTEDTDESGKFMIESLNSSGHSVSFYRLIKNHPQSIRDALSEITNDASIQAIVTIGGTGAGSRDLTIETVTPFLSKKLDGFGELFRYLTYKEIGTASIMSRALGGLIRGKVIICLPGSLNASRLALNAIILPEINHLVREAQR